MSDEEDVAVGASWDDPSDEEGVPTGPPTAEAASTELVDMLLTLYVQGRMPAKQLCIMCHWAQHAGVGSHAAALALPPGRPTGHYKRHLDAALGFTKRHHHLYELDMPGHSKSDLGRLVHSVGVQPPHELLHAEVAARPELLDEL